MMECFRRDVLGATRACATGELLPSGRGSLERLPGRSGICSNLKDVWKLTWGGDKVWVGGQHLQRFSFPGKLPGVKQRRRDYGQGTHSGGRGPAGKAGRLQRCLCVIKYYFPIECSSLWGICRIQREIFLGALVNDKPVYLLRMIYTFERNLIYKQQL